MKYWKQYYFGHEEAEDSISIQFIQCFIATRTNKDFCVVNGKQHFDFPIEEGKADGDENMIVIKQSSSFFDCP